MRARSTIAALVLAAAIASAKASALPFTFSYGGRLAGDGGKAIEGPVDLELKFFHTASAGSQIPVSPAVFTGLALDDGVFQVDLDALAPGELDLVFSATADTYVEVTDRTHKVTYPRQRFVAVPYALKVPVDGHTIGYDANGKLSVGPTAAPDSNQFLTRSADGQWIWATPANTPAASLSGKPIASVAPTSGQILKFDGTNWVPGPAPVGGPTSVTANAPLTVTSSAALSIAKASAGVDGYLAATDFAAFNGKQAALGYTPVNKTGDGMSGPLDMGAHAITSVGTPVGMFDAATKLYVDNSLQAKANSTSSVLAGAGLSGGGDLTTARTLTLKPASSSSLGGIVATSGKLTVDTNGAITSIIADALSGQLAVANGGTGTAATPSLGQLLIGAGGGSYALGSLAAGPGIIISPSGNNLLFSSDTASAPLLAHPGAQSFPGLAFITSPHTGLFVPLPDVLGLSTAGVERLRVDVNGNLGIGTTVPAARLDIRAPPGNTQSTVIVHAGFAQTADTLQIQDGNGSPIAAFEVNGDIRANGGFRQMFDGWFRNSLSTSQPDLTMDRYSSSSALIYPSALLTMRPGSITAVSIYCLPVLSTGTLTVTVYKDGVATSAAVMLGVGAPSNAAVISKDSVPFNPGQRLELHLSGSGNSTTSCRGGLEIEQ